MKSGLKIKVQNYIKCMADLYLHLDAARDSLIRHMNKKGICITEEDIHVRIDNRDIKVVYHSDYKPARTHKPKSVEEVIARNID